MTTLVMKDQPGSVPGYDWEFAGEVLPIEDGALAAQLLLIPGFREVVPDPTPEQIAAEQALAAAQVLVLQTPVIAQEPTPWSGWHAFDRSLPLGDSLVLNPPSAAASVSPQPAGNARGRGGRGR